MNRDARCVFTRGIDQNGAYENSFLQNESRGELNVLLDPECHRLGHTRQALARGFCLDGCCSCPPAPARRGALSPWVDANVGYALGGLCEHRPKGFVLIARAKRKPARRFHDSRKLAVPGNCLRPYICNKHPSASNLKLNCPPLALLSSRQQLDTRTPRAGPLAANQDGCEPPQPIFSTT